MPIKRPDIYEHNNPNFAVVASDSVRGGRRTVANLEELYQLTVKADQLQKFVTIVYVEDSGDEFLLIVDPSDNTRVSTAEGWLKLPKYKVSIRPYENGRWEAGELAIHSSGLWRADVLFSNSETLPTEGSGWTKLVDWVGSAKYLLVQPSGAHVYSDDLQYLMDTAEIQATVVLNANAPVVDIFHKNQVRINTNGFLLPMLKDTATSGVFSIGGAGQVGYVRLYNPTTECDIYCKINPFLIDNDPQSGSHDTHLICKRVGIYNDIILKGVGWLSVYGATKVIIRGDIVLLEKDEDNISTNPPGTNPYTAIRLGKDDTASLPERIRFTGEVYFTGTVQTRTAWSVFWMQGATGNGAGGKLILEDAYISNGRSADIIRWDHVDVTTQVIIKGNVVFQNNSLGNVFRNDGGLARTVKVYGTLRYDGTLPSTVTLLNMTNRSSLPDYVLSDSQKETVYASSSVMDNIAAPTDFVRFTGSGQVYISGFAATTDGRTIVVHSDIDGDLTLIGEGGSSVQTNWMRYKDGEDVTLKRNEAVAIRYSSNLQRWLILGPPSKGGIPGEEFAQDGQVPVKAGAIYDFKFPYELQEPVSLTYAELDTLRSNNELIQGNYYRITDYQTIHIIPNSVHLNVQGTPYADKTLWLNDKTEGVEGLTIVASSNNTFSPIAFSDSYPSDIIEYDFLNNVAEDGVTSRPGFITRRVHTGSELETGYDFRNCIFIRYEIIPPIYDAATTYNANTVVEYNGILYCCLLNGTVGITPSNAGNNYNWGLLMNVTAGWGGRNTLRRFVAHTTAYNIGGKTVPVNAESFRYYHTFCTLTDAASEDAVPFYDKSQLNQIKISSGYLTSLPNVVCCVSYRSSSPDLIHRVSTDVGCESITLSGYIYNMTFAKRCTSILVLNAVSVCTIADYCQNLLFANHTHTGWPCYYNNLKPNVRSMALNGCSYNEFDVEVHSNFFKSMTFRTNFPPGCVSNTFHFLCGNNRLLARLHSCVFKGTLEETTVYQRIQYGNFEQNVRWSSFMVPIQTKTFTSLIDTKMITSITASKKVFASTTDDNGEIITTEIT